MYIGKYKINQAGRGLKLSVPSYVAKNIKVEGGSEVFIFLMKGCMIVSKREPFICNHCGNYCVRATEVDELGEVFPCCSDHRGHPLLGGSCVICVLRRS